MEEFDYTKNLKLPLLIPNQSGKEYTHNEALIILDNLIQNAVISKDLSKPPENPNVNDLYIISNNATGEWTNKENYLSFYDNGWRFIQPNEGYMFWIKAKECLYTFHNNNWVKTLSVLNLEDLSNIKIESLNINNLICYDGTNFVNTNNITINKINLQNQSNQATFEFVNNDLKCKISQNLGSTWKDCFTINKDTGNIDFKQKVTQNGSSFASNSNNSSFIGSIIHGIRSDTPEGFLRCDGGEYSADIFPEFYEDYLLTNKINNVSFEVYNTTLTNNEENCGLFGIDLVNRRFKVPTIADNTYLMNSLTSTNNGKYTKAGLPNIIGEFGRGSIIAPWWSGSTSGAFSTNTKRQSFVSGSIDQQIVDNLKLDASKSNSIYGNSNTVQTKALKYPLFICVANKTAPASEVQYNNFLNEITTRLANDLTNINKIGKNKITTLVKPSNQNITLTLKASGQCYIAPVNGYLQVVAPSTAINGYLKLSNVNSLIENTKTATSGNYMNIFVPCKEDDEIAISYANIDGSNTQVKFVYDEGCKSI